MRSRSQESRDFWDGVRGLLSNSLGLLLMALIIVLQGSQSMPVIAGEQPIPLSSVSTGVFWSSPVIRDLVMTDSQSERMMTIRQMLFVSYQGMVGDEIKPETDSDGRMVIWVYRNGERFKEAPVEYPSVDGQIMPVNGYLLINGMSGDLVTFLLDAGTPLPTSSNQPTSAHST